MVNLKKTVQTAALFAMSLGGIKESLAQGWYGSYGWGWGRASYYDVWESRSRFFAKKVDGIVGPGVLLPMWSRDLKLAGFTYEKDFDENRIHYALNANNTNVYYYEARRETDGDPTTITKDDERTADYLHVTIPWEYNGHLINKNMELIYDYQHKDQLSGRVYFTDNSGKELDIPDPKDLPKEKWLSQWGGVVDAPTQPFQKLPYTSYRFTYKPTGKNENKNEKRVRDMLTNARDQAARESSPKPGFNSMTDVERRLSLYPEHVTYEKAKPARAPKP